MLLMRAVRSSDLKRWNKLLGDRLYPGQQLFVTERPPRPADEVRAQALSTIMRRAHVTQPEASYYLDEHGGGTDVEAALKAFAADATGSDQGALPLDGGEGEWVVVDAPP